MSLWAFYKLLISSSFSPVAFDISDTGNPKDFMFLAMKEIPAAIPSALPSAIPSARPLASPLASPCSIPLASPFLSAPSTKVRSVRMMSQNLSYPSSCSVV